MNTTTCSGLMCGAMLFLSLSGAVLPGCSAAHTRCPGVPDAACREMIARYELAPGEFTGAPGPVRLEERNGRKGVWIGTAVFRAIVETGNVMEKTGPGRAFVAPCGRVSEAAVEKARDDVRRLFKAVYSDELQRRSGMINYEMTLFAAEKEIAGLVKSGTVVRRDTAGGDCRVMFQVTNRCLKQLVYAENIDCK